MSNIRLNNIRLSQTLEELPNNAIVCVAAGGFSSLTNKATACKIWKNKRVLYTAKLNNITFIKI